ncbi:MAG TPA: serine/threonine-protein kinase, partial [Thermoanaerobaculia bacterium]|nr:serine/threonine-protein kinase [Thermoanaerobaculia bacterium]
MISAGTRLGPYEIVAPIGAGGMGEVYRARDTRLERTVAVKVLPSHLSASEESRQRFEREARTISQLSHPHICALYDVGREGETEYLVMEYLEGETLSERLDRGALPTDQVLRFGVEIADGLDKAHRQGIVHRDLKPGNVMLTKSGVKLLDFGLAKVVAQAAGSGASLTALPTRANLTQEGTILGTFQYMAPEQLEGREADSRTDIFAFGAVLHEMATGKKAFSGESQASLISSIMASEPPPVSAVAPLAPPALDRIVRRCLVKDPDGRWQSARDVSLELDEVARSPMTATTATTPVARRSGFAGWIVAAGLLLALLASLFGPWRRAPSAAAVVPVRFTVPPPRDAAFQGMLALSPDGRRLTFVATSSDGRDLLW